MITNICQIIWGGGDFRPFNVIPLFFFNLKLMKSVLSRCLANMLRQTQEEKLATHKEILDYIGHTFRIRMYLPEWYKDSQITEYLLR